MATKLKIIYLLFVCMLLVTRSICDEDDVDVEVDEVDDDDDESSEEKKPEKWKQKDIRDYNDADMERLFMQWEEDEEKDPDDLMEHERPPAKLDMSKIDPKNPETILQLSKKGKTLMTFVTVSGNPTQEESETITMMWQDQLFQANYQLQRFMVSSNKAIFMVKDGSLAWEMKNFLIQQDRCEEVTIDNKSYYGKGSGKKTNEKGEPLEGEEEDKSKKAGKAKKKGKSKKKTEGQDNDTKEKDSNVRIADPTREKQKKKFEENKTEL